MEFLLLYNINTAYYRILLILILLFINIFLKIKTFKAPIDHDDSSHIYFGFLKMHKIRFLSSYNFGIKYILPRMYFVLIKWIKDKPYRFRIFNILSSSIIIMLWVFSDNLISLREIPFYIIAVLLINSLWIDLRCSETELHSVLFILLIFILNNFFQLNIILLIIILTLLLFLFVGFKIVDILYLFPILAFNFNKIFSYWYIFLLYIFIYSIFIFIFFKNITNRKINDKRHKFGINPKGLVFIKRSFDFILLILLISIINIFYGNFGWITLQLTVILILLIQRKIVTYFFYPMVVIGLFIAFQINWLEKIPIYISLIILFYIFFTHTLRYILLKKPREMVVKFREIFIGNPNWDYYLNNRDEQVKWLVENIDKKRNAYLWGVNIYLFLKANILHSPNTYYNHDFLINWSRIRDKNKYLEEYIKKEKPDYIIESQIMNNYKFPIDSFSYLYKHIYSLYDMNVYKRI